jgi:beta-glucosidase
VVPAAALAKVLPSAVYRDSRAPTAARVADLLSRMTLEEKAAQLCSIWMRKSQLLDAAGNFAPDEAMKSIPDGIGLVYRPGDNTGWSRSLAEPLRSIEGTIAFVNAFQRFLVEKTRLGIPVMFHEETAHGLAEKDATVFPAPPALGSTWDPDLVEEVFSVAGREARRRGATLALSPVLDLAREPRWGRVEEFFGEDPHLVSAMGAASVRGQQGPRPLGPDKVFVTLKHFVHGSPQAGINTAPSEAGERALRENYLRPFEHVIATADPAAIMPSYNEVEGVPSHANRALLIATGRERFGFKGAYLSDYGGIAQLRTQHSMANDDAGTAVLAMNAGVDVDLQEGEAYRHLPDLVRSGRIAQEQVDAAVSRILALKFEAGLFENPYVNVRSALRGTNTADDVALARRAAQKAMVLVKNDGLLPLKLTEPLRIAVIGPNARDHLFGGYSGANDKAQGLLAGLIAAAKGTPVTIEYAEGVRIIAPPVPTEPIAMVALARPADKAVNERLIAEAAELAGRSDVVVLAVGDRPQITREATLRILPGDRHDLGLYGQQDELVDAVIASGKPIAAVLLNGRALAVSRLADGVNAMLEGWYLGQEGGNALADVLFGKVNPGGKLAVTFPRSVGDLPIFYNRHPSSDLNDYVEGKREPLFAFGHGLSYTTFDISAPRLANPSIGVGDGATVRVDVTNTGPRIGDEVVQLYVRDNVSSVPRPVLELKGFRRVTLKPGEQRTLEFMLSPDDLALWDINMQWRVEPGEFTNLAGASSTSMKSAMLTFA